MNSNESRYGDLRGLFLTAVIGGLMLAAPAQAQRTSLESLAADHDDIQDAQNAGATPIFACGTIDTPGSYVVVQNLGAIGDCLLITASDATIDLGGHVLSGDTTGAGVKAVLDGLELRRNITVRNGTVKRFSDGVHLNAALDTQVLKIRAVSNTNFGILVGRGAIVTGNIASRNGQDGIQAPAGNSHITGNVANENGDEGIQAGAESTITGNTATRNVGTGIAVGGSSSLIAGNNASGNDGNGISAVCPANVIGNMAFSNNGQNFNLTGGTCNSVDNWVP